MSPLCLQSGTEQWCPPAPQPPAERQDHSPSVCCLSNRLICIQLPKTSLPARMQMAGSALPARPQRCHVPRFPWARSACHVPARVPWPRSEQKGKRGAATAGTGSGDSRTSPGTGTLHTPGSRRANAPPACPPAPRRAGTGCCEPWCPSLVLSLPGPAGLSAPLPAAHLLMLARTTGRSGTTRLHPHRRSPRIALA